MADISASNELSLSDPFLGLIDADNAADTAFILGTPTLIVEGPGDYDLLEQHLRHLGIEVVVAEGGKQAVLASARDEYEQGSTNVLFLIDTDFDELLSRLDDYPANVVRSARHDIFMDLAFHENATHARRLVHGQSTGIASDVRPTVETLLSETLASSRTFRLIRIINDEKRAGLNLKKCGIDVRFDPQYDIHFKVERAYDGSADASVTVEQFVRIVESRQNDAHLYDHWVGDHDFFNALARALKVRGAKMGGEKELVKAFIGGITCQDLARQPWHSQILAKFANAHPEPACSMCRPTTQAEGLAAQPDALSATV